VSHAAWVRSHGADAPAALLARVDAILAADPSLASLPVADALLKASETLLAAVLAGEGEGREVALDLLAADACVTWAFEAAAADPSSLSARAERSMQRVAEVAK
jgi:hypothetical protein